MTKSRMAAALIFASLPLAMPAAAQAPPDDDPVARQARQVHDLVAPCARSGGEDEIVVCGRRGDEVGPQEHRLPLPVEREPGERVRLIAGEPPSAMAALGASESCCGSHGGIDLLNAVRLLGRGLDRLLHPY